MNRVLLTRPERAERKDARADETHRRGLSVVPDHEGDGCVMLTGGAPLDELAQYAPASVELIYCAGILHRMTRAEGGALVTACFRALKALGSIRVATINLDRVVQSYLFDWTGEGDARASRTARLNAALREPGTQFIYGEEELTKILAQAGFADIRRFAPGASPIRQFWNLEPDHAHALVLEATRP